MMTLMHSLHGTMVLAVEDAETDEARSLSESFVEAKSTAMRLEIESTQSGSHTVQVPSALAGLIQEVINNVGQGGTHDDSVTTPAAAH